MYLLTGLNAILVILRFDHGHSPDQKNVPMQKNLPLHYDRMVVKHGAP